MRCVCVYVVGVRAHNSSPTLVHALNMLMSPLWSLAASQAITVVRRVKSKLLGTDFGTLSCTDGPLDVPTQIELLIGEAQSHFNLCQLYVGWNPFW